MGALAPLFNHLYEVGDLIDHTAHGRGVLQFAGLVHLVQAQPISVSRWSLGRRIGLPICLTTTVLANLCVLSGNFFSFLNGFLTTGNEVRNLHSATRSNTAGAIFEFQTLNGRANHVVGVL